MTKKMLSAGYDFGGGDPLVGVFPASGLGLIAMTSDPYIHAGGSTTVANNRVMLTRLWIPAGKALTNLWVAVRGAGTQSGGSAPCRLGLYSDAGSLIGSTANDTTLFTSTGWRGGAMTGGAIAAEGAGRFVYVGYIAGGVSNANVPTSFGTSDSHYVFVSIGPGVSNRRCMYQSSLSDLPSSFDPTSYGTATGVLPLVGIS